MVGQSEAGPLISPKTLALMTANYLPGGADLTTLSRALFSEAGNAGVGFGLGFGVVIDPAKTLVQVSPLFLILGTGFKGIPMTGRSFGNRFD